MNDETRIDPKHGRVRPVLRVLGPIILVAGVVLFGVSHPGASYVEIRSAELVADAEEDEGDRKRLPCADDRLHGQHEHGDLPGEREGHGHDVAAVFEAGGGALVFGQRVEAFGPHTVRSRPRAGHRRPGGLDGWPPLAARRAVVQARRNGCPNHQWDKGLMVEGSAGDPVRRVEI